MVDTQVPPQVPPAVPSQAAPGPAPAPAPARRRSNEDVFRTTTVIFSLLALLLAFGGLVVASQAWRRADQARSDVTKLAAGSLLGTKVNVTMQEFSLLPRPDQVKAGTVQMTIHNAGTMTHEMVLVRAPSVAALPRVTVATAERAVGDVDEEAIPAADKMGETGDVKAGQTVVHTFHLTAGTYVMFCNIDDKLPDGTVLNHFQHGMSATITAA